MRMPTSLCTAHVVANVVAMGTPFVLLGHTSIVASWNFDVNSTSYGQTGNTTRDGRRCACNCERVVYLGWNKCGSK